MGHLYLKPFYSKEKSATGSNSVNKLWPVSSPSLEVVLLPQLLSVMKDLSERQRVCAESKINIQTFLRRSFAASTNSPGRTSSIV